MPRWAGEPCVELSGDAQWSTHGGVSGRAPVGLGRGDKIVLRFGQPARGQPSRKVRRLKYVRPEVVSAVLEWVFCYDSSISPLACCSRIGSTVLLPNEWFAERL